jgi:hypothetical protein
MTLIADLGRNSVLGADKNLTIDAKNTGNELLGKVTYLSVDGQLTGRILEDFL